MTTDFITDTKAWFYHSLRGFFASTTNLSLVDYLKQDKAVELHNQNLLEWHRNYKAEAFPVLPFLSYLAQ